MWPIDGTRYRNIVDNALCTLKYYKTIFSSYVSFWLQVHLSYLLVIYLTNYSLYFEDYFHSFFLKYFTTHFIEQD